MIKKEFRKWYSRIQGKWPIAPVQRTSDILRREGSEQNKNEHVLTCLSASPSSAIVIRTAAKMAKAFHAEFTALFVERGADHPGGERVDPVLQSNLQLAEKLGARIATVYGDNAAIRIAEYAKAAAVTKVVIGRTNHRNGVLIKRKSLVDQLIQLLPDMDIYIIPGNQPSYRRNPFRRRNMQPISGWGMIKTVLVLAGVSVLGLLFRSMGMSVDSIPMLYLLGVLVVSLVSNGWFYGVAASLGSVIVFNFLFTEPRFTLWAYDPSYSVTFLVMLAVSFITNYLMQRLQTTAKETARKAYRTEVLLETSQKLQKAEGTEEILKTTAGQLYKLLERAILFYEPDEKGELKEPWIYPDREGQQDRNEDERSCKAVSEPDRSEGPCVWQSEADRQAVQWAWTHNKHAGAGTSVHADAAAIYLTIRGKGQPMAVAGILIKDQPVLPAFERNILLAVLDECGMVMEKERLNREKQEAQMQMQKEALRANLLRSISHDLRTPLTSITGHAGILMENSRVLDETKKQMLYSDIYDDSQWLINLVENLLSVTRIEDGTMQMKQEPELLEDVLREALSHLDRRSTEHEIRWSLEEDMIMARMDVRLMVQVIINMVNNAIQYTPAGSVIQVRASREKGQNGTPTGRILVEIEDDGPGVEDSVRDKLFDMFYTADNARGDGRRGLGLGLSLCKAIVTAHQGEIGVRAAEPRGSVFYFTLQEVDPYE